MRSIALFLPLITLWLLALVSQPSFANADANPKVISNSFSHLQSIAGTKQYVVQSAQRQQAYYLHVLLPDLDEAEQKKANKLPVVYLLDGGLTFPMLAAYYHTLALLDNLPPMIVVGVGYGTQDWRQGNSRGQDYTMPSEEREHWGGAEDFSKVLRRQIFPFIEGEFAADPNKRVLMGTSLGGQYGLYLASFQPDLVYGVIANNPAIHTNTQTYINQLNKLKEPIDLKLFIASAEHDAEVFAKPRAQWLAALAKLEQPPWDMEIREMPGHAHLTSIPEAFRQGLTWMFPIKPEK